MLIEKTAFPNADVSRLSMNSKPCWQFCVDSNGVFHLIFESYPSTYCEIYYSFSTDAGDTWSEPVRLDEETYSISGYCCIVDSSGTLHVCWTSQVAMYQPNKKLSYRTRSVAGEWGSIESITLGAGNNGFSGSPKMFIDSDGKINFILRQQGGSVSATTYQIAHWIKDGYNSFSRVSYITDTSNHQSSLDICVDSNGYPHILFRSKDWGTNTTKYRPHYTFYNGSSWSTPAVIYEYSRDYNIGGIAIDNENNILVGFNYGGGYQYACYKPSGGSFGYTAQVLSGANGLGSDVQSDGDNFYIVTPEGSGTTMKVYQMVGIPQYDLDTNAFSLIETGNIDTNGDMAKTANAGHHRYPSSLADCQITSGFIVVNGEETGTPDSFAISYSDDLSPLPASSPDPANISVSESVSLVEDDSLYIYEQEPSISAAKDSINPDGWKRGVRIYTP